MSFLNCDCLSCKEKLMLLVSEHMNLLNCQKWSQMKTYAEFVWGECSTSFDTEHFIHGIFAKFIGMVHHHGHNVKGRKLPTQNGKWCLSLYSPQHVWICRQHSHSIANNAVLFVHKYIFRVHLILVYNGNWEKIKLKHDSTGENRLMNGFKLCSDSNN